MGMAQMNIDTSYQFHACKNIFVNYTYTYDN